LVYSGLHERIINFIVNEIGLYFYYFPEKQKNEAVYALTLAT